MTPNNPLGLDGIEFIEFASPKPEDLHRLFTEFGFSKTAAHSQKAIDLYTQNEIRLLLNRDATSFGATFSSLHGPSICSMGWRVRDAQAAYNVALKRGARPALQSDYLWRGNQVIHAVWGIGESLIYLIDHFRDPDLYEQLGFEPCRNPSLTPSKGFLTIDHLTNNVPKGTMRQWGDFYKSVFGFTEVRYFDIKGAKTGLQSYALRSPCGKFCIPINEADEEKSQINEYLREYRGPGIQHLAFLTDDIIQSMRALDGSSITTLDIDPDYYQNVFKRLPQVTEDRSELERRKILVDGDENGYLLQIFTRNLIGPIFIEIIQRKNHLSFGEGNFQALFRSIERDQAKRGVFGEESRSTGGTTSA